MHVGCHRPGAVQGNQSSDVVKSGWGETAHQTPHRRGLELENSQGIAGLQEFESFFVIERDLFEINFGSSCDFDQFQSFVDDRQCA